MRLLNSQNGYQKLYINRVVEVIENGVRKKSFFGSTSVWESISFEQLNNEIK